MKTQLTLLFLLLLNSISTHAQSELSFSFECSKDIKPPIVCRVFLQHPSGSTSGLLSDTISSYDFSTREFVSAKGLYTLSVYFEAEIYGRGAIDYQFELNGAEEETHISLNVDVKEERDLHGYVMINKYYKAPESVDISLDHKTKGTKFYKGPFFKIKNNTRDTLYGVHLPGYFWGSLLFIRNDSTLHSRTGVLDYEFIASPPLYPDSTKTATVGSFGIANQLIPFEYRYEVLLSQKWQSLGIGVYEEQETLTWWAGTKEYYRLSYDFEVK